MSHEVVNTIEAAARLGVSPSFVAKLRMSGNGPVFRKLGRRVVYRISDLDEWLGARSHRSTSEPASA